MTVDRSNEIIAEIRKIIRAVSLHSKSLSKTYGFTGPQLMILTEIEKNDGTTVSELAKRISLSQATVTSVLGRLEQRNLVHRNRSIFDKRKVQLEITPQGKEALFSKPSLLQEDFVDKFNNLEDWEQSLLISSLQRIALMMGAENTSFIPLFSDEAISEK